MLFTENAANSSLRWPAIGRDGSGTRSAPNVDPRSRLQSHSLPRPLSPGINHACGIGNGSILARPRRGEYVGPAGEFACWIAGWAAAKRAPMAADKVGLGSIRRPVIGLALGGGAARGFAHIGIIRTLVAHGIIPNVVVGTSIGAVVGGAYASGHLDALEEWARSLQPRSIFSYLDIRLNGSGLIGGAKLAAELEAAMGQSLIEDLPMKFATVATEVRTGHEIWLTHGRDGGCDARLLCAARNILAGAGRRPLAGRRRAGQSGAGVGGARARRGDRHRRQSFQRRLHALHDDLFPRPDARRFGIGDAGSGPNPSRANAASASSSLPSAP